MQVEESVTVVESEKEICRFFLSSLQLIWKLEIIWKKITKSELAQTQRIEFLFIARRTLLNLLGVDGFILNIDKVEWFIIFSWSPPPLESNRATTQKLSAATTDMMVAYLCQARGQFAACLPVTPRYQWHETDTEREEGIRNSNPFFLESFIISFSSRMFPKS